MGYGRGRHSRGRFIPKLLGRMILLLVIFCGGFALYYIANDLDLPFGGQAEEPHSAGRREDGGGGDQDQGKERGEEEGDWQLILVNKWHPMPEDYQVELTQLSNGQSVDSRI